MRFTSTNTITIVLALCGESYMVVPVGTTVRVSPGMVVLAREGRTTTQIWGPVPQWNE